MKRLIILTLVPALLLGSLAGCGRAPKAVDVYDQPPALVIMDPEGDTAAELDSMGYQWTYSAGSGRSTVWMRTPSIRWMRTFWRWTSCTSIRRQTPFTPCPLTLPPPR